MRHLEKSSQIWWQNLVVTLLKNEILCNLSRIKYSFYDININVTENQKASLKNFPPNIFGGKIWRQIFSDAIM